MAASVIAGEIAEGEMCGMPPSPVTLAAAASVTGLGERPGDRVHALDGTATGSRGP